MIFNIGSASSPAGAAQAGGEQANSAAFSDCQPVNDGQ